MMTTAHAEASLLATPTTPEHPHIKGTYIAHPMRWFFVVIVQLSLAAQHTCVLANTPPSQLPPVNLPVGVGPRAWAAQLGGGAQRC